MLVAGATKLVKMDRAFFKELLNYLKRFLVIDVMLCLLVLVSFFVTSNFSANNYSDRIFWVGIGAILLCGVGVLTIAIAGTDFGNPRDLLKAESAHSSTERFRNMRTALESRYDFCILMWLVGLSLIGISALVQQLFGK